MEKRIPVLELANVDTEAANKEDLVDVSDFTFDNTVPQEQRTSHIIAMIKNPYCFRVGDMGVKLEFSENARPLQVMFAEFLKHKKSGLQNLSAGRDNIVRIMPKR